MVGRLEGGAHLERLRQTLEVIANRSCRKRSAAWGPISRAVSGQVVEALSKGFINKCCTAGHQPAGPPATASTAPLAMQALNDLFASMKAAARA